LIVHAQTPDQRAQLLTYIAQKIGYAPRDLVGDMPYHAAGSIKDGRIVGGALFTNFRRHSIEVHVCGEPGWVTRGDLKSLFWYPFVHLGCLRLWCLIARNNKPSRSFCERLGFKVKCVSDDEFGPGKDGIVYAMKRSECKWLG
jgi:RimJ/RimL family protein N-acetyltransferase